ncbi:hypothetical protein OG884_33530 [Streptosporangium sp. NBC_01755]|nr:hypothetical protein [Streptosporangium sp. NBC_01755]WSC99676.1 hypothetical protein OG884_33530 [Streptosporangium sp. NBC_01755]
MINGWRRTARRVQRAPVGISKPRTPVIEGGSGCCAPSLPAGAMEASRR